MKKIALILLLLVFPLAEVCYAQRGYDSAMEDRIKRERSEDRYWDNQEKLRNYMYLEDLESQVKYRAEKRKQDLEKSKKIRKKK